MKTSLRAADLEDADHQAGDHHQDGVPGDRGEPDERGQEAAAAGRLLAVLQDRDPAHLLGRQDM